MKGIIKDYFKTFFSCALSSCKISALLFQPIMCCFKKRHISFHIIRKKTFSLLDQHKTLPETQRTRSIESISSVNLSSRIVHEWFQWHYLNWIGCKFGHQIATCINYKFCLPVPIAASVTNFCYEHCSAAFSEGGAF